MYNELQDNILNTQQMLNSLYRRQSRIEHFIIRMAQSEQLNNNNTDTNADILNQSSTTTTPSTQTTTQPTTQTTLDMNNSNEYNTIPPISNIMNTTTTTNTTPFINSVDEPPPTTTPSVNSVFSNIFNNIPNFLPTTTISSLNRNYRNPTDSDNSYTNNSTESNVPDYLYDNIYSRNRNRRYLNSQNMLNEYNTIIYRPIREDGRIDWGTLNNPYRVNNNNETPNNSIESVPSQLIESLLFAIINSSNDNNVEETMLTNDEITIYIKNCEFKDIVNPLNSTCPITMEAFQPNTVVMQLINCGHVFNEPELRKWITMRRICPICRNNITQSR
jgi:hypothetical protein